MPMITESEILHEFETAGIKFPPVGLVDLCVKGQLRPTETIAAAYKRQLDEQERAAAEEKRTGALAKQQQAEYDRLQKTFPALHGRRS